MLFNCPECRNQVSSKALFCPACGYPVNQKSRAARRSNRTKRRLPNGFGSITRLKNKNLRKPYLARITVGKTDKGRPITRNLRPNAYFKTYNEAYTALIEYNRNPYSFDKDLSVRDVLGLFMGKFYKEGHSATYTRAIERAQRRSEALNDMKLRELKPRHLKGLLEELDLTVNEQLTFKLFWNRVFDYAVEYELADHNYARDFNLEEKVVKRPGKKPHISFTDEEMDKLWENKENEIVKMILVQCYMGWRPNELCSLTKEDVDLESWSITAGSKTDAGINRTVPIHTRIRPLIEDAVKQDKRFLFYIESEAVNYGRYHYYFGKTMKQLGLNLKHKPHDPRKHFVTMAKRSKVDEYVIKILVGHAISDITENMYTDRDLEWLRSEIEKIK